MTYEPHFPRKNLSGCICFCQMLSVSLSCLDAYGENVRKFFDTGYGKFLFSGFLYVVF